MFVCGRDHDLMSAEESCLSTEGVHHWRFTCTVKPLISGHRWDHLQQLLDCLLSRGVHSNERLKMQCLCSMTVCPLGSSVCLMGGVH